MNKGVKAATGEMLYFLGSDDYFLNDKVVEKIVSECRVNKTLPDLIYGNVVFYNSFHKRIERAGRKMAINDIARGLRPPHQASFTKKDTLIKFGCFDTSYKICSDFDFFAKIFKDPANKIVYCNADVAFYSKDGLSSKNANKLALETSLIIKNIFGYKQYLIYLFSMKVVSLLKLIAKKTKLINLYYKFVLLF
jgi:glycosyltransferase involved in cell wall biosynthesis